MSLSLSTQTSTDALPFLYIYRQEFGLKIKIKNRILSIDEKKGHMGTYGWYFMIRPFSA